MSIDLIETIIKMDNGHLMISKTTKSLYNDKAPTAYEIDLRCRFGNLKAECKHLDEGIAQVCKMYQVLEEGNVSVTTVPF